VFLCSACASARTQIFVCNFDLFVLEVLQINHKFFGECKIFEH
jgi:hypothetical protein